MGTLGAELVRVRGPIEAEVVRSILENNGIPVRCRSDVLHAVMPFTVDGLGEVCIFVAEGDLAAAEDLLAHHRHAGFTIVPPESDAGEGDEVDDDDGATSEVGEG